MRLHLDHDDVILDKTYNNSFQQRLVEGSSAEVYQGLGLESLQNRWCFQKLRVISRIVKKTFPKIFHLIPSNNNSYQTRNGQNLVIAEIKVRNNFFLNFFFSSALVEWNKLDSDIRNSPSYSTFNKNIIIIKITLWDLIVTKAQPKGLIFLTRLRVGLSYFREHKFKHSFLYTLNPICICITLILLYGDRSFPAEFSTNILIYWLHLIHKKVWIYSLYTDLIRVLNVQKFSFHAY